jgi:polyhydroxybutyrate depolymerase
LNPFSTFTRKEPAMVSRFAAIFLLFAAWAASAGACERRDLLVGSEWRAAGICMPAGNPSTEPRTWPVVIVFHGRGGDAGRFLEETRFHEQWPQALVVYPNGRLNASGKPERGWQMLPGQDDDKDLLFFDVMVSALFQRYPQIDPNRVFVTGHSNGSRFAGVLWKMRGAYITRLAFSAGPAHDMIKTSPPRSVFMSMGANDYDVPLDWQYPSVINAADLLGIPRDNFNRDPGLKQAFSNGGLELMTSIHQHGHAWPPGQTLQIVEFFKRSSNGR